MLCMGHLLIHNGVLKGVEKKLALIRKMNVFLLQYSLIHQVYKYLKANMFNDQGIDPTLIEKIATRLPQRGI